MNKGLKNYTKQISKSLDGTGEVYVNINKNDANAHVVIPLLTSVGQSPISTSLIFDYQNRNEVGMFGKGVKLNWYGKVSRSTSGVHILNADGSQDTFVYESQNTYANKERQMRVEVQPLSGYANDADYLFSDKNGGTIKYVSTMLDYPKTVTAKSGEQYTSDFINAVPYISNGKGDTVEFTKVGTMATKAEWKKNGVSLLSVEFSYENDCLTKLIYKKGDTVLSETALAFSETEIVLRDVKTCQCVKCDVASGKVMAIKDGYSSDLGATVTGGSTTTITYESDTLSSVSDEYGNKSYVLFDKSGMPIFDKDLLGRVVKTSFDPETKAVVSQSSPINTTNMASAIQPYGFSCDANLNKTTSVCTDSFFKPLVGETTCKYVTSDNANNIKNATASYTISGIATDTITAIIWAKQLTPMSNVGNTVKKGVVAKLIVGSQECQAVFDKKTIDDNFDVMILGVNAKEDFSKVDLKLYFCDNSSLEIGKIQILKKEIGAFYKYGKAGNLEEMSQGENQTIIAYDDDNQPIEAAGSDGTEYDYEYDDNGNPTRIWGAYNVRIDNEYDPVIKTNIKKQIVSNVDESKKIVTSKEYNSSFNNVSKEKDELDNETCYEYNALGNVKKITDAMGVVTEFSYQNDTIIKDMLLKNGNATAMGAHYDYDAANRIKKVSLENGSVYEFEYDVCGNISAIKLNGIVAYSYEYDSKGRLVSQTYGNGDKYVFSYENELIRSVSFAKSGTQGEVKFSYEYDANKRVSKVHSGAISGPVLTEYTYDDNDRVIKQSGTSFEVSKTYDNVGNIATQLNTVGGYGVYQSNEPIRHSKYRNTTSVFDSFKYSSFVGDFSRNAKLSHEDQNIYPVTHSGDVQRNIMFKKENGLRYVRIDRAHLLSYRPTKDFPDAFECGNVEFWFRQSLAADAVLFSCKGSGKSYIEASLKQGRVVVNVIDMNGKSYTVLTSEDEVVAGSWNFFALDFHNRDDGEGYIDECRYRIMLNGKSQMYRKTDPRLYVDVSGDPIYNIGHGYNTALSNSVFFGDIACLRIFPRNCATVSQETQFYNYSKAYIEGTLTPSLGKIEDRSSISLFAQEQSVFSGYDIYPLQKNVYSLTGKKPVSFEMRTFGRTNSYKDEMFELDEDTKRYAYLANGSSLVYQFGKRSCGTAIIRAKTSQSGWYRQIFESKDTSGSILGLYCDTDNILYIDHEGTKIKTSLEFTPRQWHTVGLSFRERVEDSSIIFSSSVARKPVLPIQMYIEIRVFLDGKSFYCERLIGDTPSQRNVMVGRKFARANINDNKPFVGLMETLAICSDDITLREFSRVAEKLDCISKSSKYDEFGLYKGLEISKSGASILSSEVDYKSLDKTENGKSFKQLSHVVSEERISAGGSALTTRTYTTDKLGRVTGIADSKFGNHSYEYDCRGFLVKDGDTVYEYDANGNVTKIGNTVLEYDSVVKDKLVKVGDKVVTYDANNPLVPTSYDGNIYTFEGRRLTKIQKGGKVIDYTYNDQGLRIKKTVTENGTSLETRIFYDDNKLVAEISPTHRLDFLYDENERLYGFVLDKTAMYFYVRDTLENILGIIDKNGNLVVQYAYNAWGKPESTTGTLATTIGEYNPFRYKGYHFDSDTSMYYCRTRYYVPDWCRWLCADGVGWLDPSSLFEQNLYCYCNNNPVCCIDPSGRFGFLALVAITLTSMIIGGGTQLISNAIAGKKGSELWRGVAGAALGTGVNALALCLAMPTGGASLVIAAGISSAVQTGVDTLETIIRGEDVDWEQTLIDLGINFASSLVGNFIGGKVIPTNAGWFQTKKFMSVFTKSYGQKLLLQTVVGAGISGLTSLYRAFKKINKKNSSLRSKKQWSLDF